MGAARCRRHRVIGGYFGQRLDVTLSERVAVLVPLTECQRLSVDFTVGQFVRVD
jgi:hypothetical protein